MAKVNKQAVSANTVKILLDSTQVGVGQNARWNDDFGLEDLSGIGDAETVEHVIGKAVYTFSMGFMSLRTQSLFSAGVASPDITTALKGLIFDIEIYETDTGALLKKYVGCTYGSGDGTIDKHAILVYNANWKALTISGNYVTNGAKAQ